MEKGVRVGFLDFVLDKRGSKPAFFFSMSIMSVV